MTENALAITSSDVCDNIVNCIYRIIGTCCHVLSCAPLALSPSCPPCMRASIASDDL